jgi:hypothetical protein
MFSFISEIFSADLKLEADWGTVDIGSLVFEVARELATNGISLD